MEVMTQSDAHSDNIFRITRLVDPPGLRLEGELDATRHGDLTEALSPLVAKGSEVRLDLEGLNFIDLGALSVLTSFVKRCDSSVLLVLDHIPPDVENVITTVGWERLPGLVQGRMGAA